MGLHKNELSPVGEKFTNLYNCNEGAFWIVELIQFYIYPAVNLTICLLTFGPTQTRAWMVHFCCLNTKKHCFPEKNKTMTIHIYLFWVEGGIGWVSDHCLTPNGQSFNYIMARKGLLFDEMMMMIIYVLY